MLKQSTQRLGSQATYLPLKVNSAGVIPVIFSMAFFLLPRTLTLFFPDASWAQKLRMSQTHLITMVWLYMSY